MTAFFGAGARRQLSAPCQACDARTSNQSRICSACWRAAPAALAAAVKAGATPQQRLEARAVMVRALREKQQ